MLLLRETHQKTGPALKVEKCEGKSGKLQGTAARRKERGFVLLPSSELKELNESETDGPVELLWPSVLRAGNYSQEKILMNHQCPEEESEIHLSS